MYSLKPDNLTLLLPRVEEVGKAVVNTGTQIHPVRLEADSSMVGKRLGRLILIAYFKLTLNSLGALLRRMEL